MRLTWLRRRGWLIAASAVACALIAVTIASVLPDKYTAEAIVAVPAGSGDSLVGVDGATKLARTYAQLIPSDGVTLSAIGKKLGLTEKSVERRIAVANEPGTSLLRVRFRGRSNAEAVRGARVAAALLTDGEELSATLDSGLMTIVRLPERAQATGEAPLSHVAESVLLIPPTGGGGGPGNAGEASNLATSYADLIPADRAIAQSLAREVGRDPDLVEKNTAVTNDFNTTIVRLLFSDSDPAVALKGARYLAESVSGPSPVSAQIAPRSLTIVRLPSQVTSQAMGTRSVALLGAILGVILGVVLLLAWERSDPRIDDLETLAAEIDCPTTSLEHASDESTAALLDRWAALAGSEPAHVALLPVSVNAEPAAAHTCGELNRVGSLNSRRTSASESSPPSLQEAKIVLGLGGIPGSDSAGEGVAIHSDVSVLVVTKGTRIAELRRTLDVLDQYGVAPVWAVMAPTVQARQPSAAPTGPRAVTSAPSVDKPARPDRKAPTRRARRTLGVDRSQNVVSLSDADSPGRPSSRPQPDEADQSGARGRSARSSSLD
jgi:capsular polysaccharide biosynthesis protein